MNRPDPRKTACRAFWTGLAVRLQPFPRLAKVVQKVLILSLLIQSVLAVPPLLNHQGRMAVNGVNFEGTGQFKFALVNATGTTTYWSNDGTSTGGSQPTASVAIPVVKGLYALLLGDTSIPNMSAVPPTVFDQDNVLLRVWFSNGPLGFQQISPDQRLAAAPYALVASKVEQVLLSSVVAPPVKPVVAWGGNDRGQATVPPLANVAALAAGTSHSLALLKSGALVQWGAMASAPGGLTNVTQISAGAAHNLVRRSDGTVAVWGDDTYGQSAAQVGITTATKVSAGEKHSLVLLANGTLVAWGDNTFGQRTIPGGATNVTAIASGYDHNLALKADGTVVAWGRDDVGQVSGTTTIVGIPNATQVVLSRNLPSGTNNLTYGGTISLSSVSNGTTTVDVSATSALTVGMTVTGAGIITPASLTNVMAIACGAFHSLAVKSDGTVVAWGWDNDGQSLVPSGLSGVSQVAGGYDFSMALKTDGTLVTWGSNAANQQVIPSGTAPIIAMAAGATHALALRPDLIPAQVARLDQENVFTQNIGLGRTPAVNALEVEGNASKTTAGTWLSNSDRRIKTDIQSITGALEKLGQVRLVDFRYTDEYRAQHPGIEDKRYLNVIAQEFAQVFPSDVHSSGEKLPHGSEEILQVDTYPLTIYSAAAVQELNQALQAKDREIAAFKDQLAAQEARLRRLEEKLK